MSRPATSLRIGFIPLAEAAALIVAADKDFAAAEGLDIELVRKVSWSTSEHGLGRIRTIGYLH